MNSVSPDVFAGRQRELYRLAAVLDDCLKHVPLKQTPEYAVFFQRLRQEMSYASDLARTPEYKIPINLLTWVKYDLAAKKKGVATFNIAQITWDNAGTLKSTRKNLPECPRSLEDLPEETRVVASGEAWWLPGALVSTIKGKAVDPATSDHLGSTPPDDSRRTSVRKASVSTEENPGKAAASTARFWRGKTRVTEAARLGQYMGPTTQVTDKRLDGMDISPEDGDNDHEAASDDMQEDDNAAEVTPPSRLRPKPSRPPPNPTPSRPLPTTKPPLPRSTPQQTTVRMSADGSPAPSTSKKVLFDGDDSDTDYDIKDLYVEAVAACASCQAANVSCQVNFKNASNCIRCSQRKRGCSFVPKTLSKEGKLVTLPRRLALFRQISWEHNRGRLLARGLEVPRAPSPMSVRLAKKRWGHLLAAVKPRRRRVKKEGQEGQDDGEGQDDDEDDDGSVTTTTSARGSSRSRSRQPSRARSMSRSSVGSIAPTPKARGKRKRRDDSDGESAGDAPSETESIASRTSRGSAKKAPPFKQQASGAGKRGKGASSGEDRTFGQKRPPKRPRTVEPEIVPQRFNDEDSNNMEDVVDKLWEAPVLTVGTIPPTPGPSEGRPTPVTPPPITPRPPAPAFQGLSKSAQVFARLAYLDKKMDLLLERMEALPRHMEGYVRRLFETVGKREMVDSSTQVPEPNVFEHLRSSRQTSTEGKRVETMAASHFSAFAGLFDTSVFHGSENASVIPMEEDQPPPNIDPMKDHFKIGPLLKSISDRPRTSDGNIISTDAILTDAETSEHKDISVSTLERPAVVAQSQDASNERSLEAKAGTAKPSRTLAEPLQHPEFAAEPNYKAVAKTQEDAEMQSLSKNDSDAVAVADTEAAGVAVADTEAAQRRSSEPGAAEATPPPLTIQARLPGSVEDAQEYNGPDIQAAEEQVIEVMPAMLIDTDAAPAPHPESEGTALEEKDNQQEDAPSLNEFEKSSNSSVDRDASNSQMETGRATSPVSPAVVETGDARPLISSSGVVASEEEQSPSASAAIAETSVAPSLASATGAAALEAEVGAELTLAGSASATELAMTEASTTDVTA